MTGRPPLHDDLDGKAPFDDEDRETLREVIAEYRSRKAVRATVVMWGKYLLIASGVLIALTQLRDAIRSVLQMK